MDGLPSIFLLFSNDEKDFSLRKLLVLVKGIPLISREERGYSSAQMKRSFNVDLRKSWNETSQMCQRSIKRQYQTITIHQLFIMARKKVVFYIFCNNLYWLLFEAIAVCTKCGSVFSVISFFFTFIQVLKWAGSWKLKETKFLRTFVYCTSSSLHGKWALPKPIFVGFKI